MESKFCLWKDQWFAALFMDLLGDLFQNRLLLFTLIIDCLHISSKDYSEEYIFPVATAYFTRHYD